MNGFDRQLNRGVQVVGKSSIIGMFEWWSAEELYVIY